MSWALLGCAASVGAEAKSGESGLQRKDTRILHEDCNVSSANERLDANADGRPDILIVRDGAREVCRSVDLNFDGVVDVWVYLDQQGNPRRKEFDFDRDGRIDEIQVFRNGALSERHRAATLANRLDTWDYFKDGVLVRSERDSNGNAVVDQWWEYPEPGCPLIHSDTTGNGRPDPGATVNYCKETGYVPPERQASSAPKSPSFERPGGELPTEVDSKPTGEQK